jgi:recombination protein RecT
MSTAITLKDKSQNLERLLNERMIQIAKSLPAGTMTPDYFARVVLTLCGKTPKLYDCTPASLLGAVMQCAQLGLAPDPVLGEAWFLPFKGIVTFVPGYKGLIKLAYQSNQVAKFAAHVVRDGDDFDYEYGLRDRLRHKPKAPVTANITHAYAIMKIKGGDANFIVLPRDEIEAIRKRSPAVRSGASTPWDTDYAAMAQKSALRRVTKLGPSSVHPPLARALALDEQAENGLRQGLSELVPGIAKEEPETDEQAEERALADAALEAENKAKTEDTKK